MPWFILVIVAVVGLFTANRVLFAAAFIVLFVGVGVQRTMTDFDVAVGHDFVGQRWLRRPRRVVRRFHSSSIQTADKINWYVG